MQTLSASKPFSGRAWATRTRPLWIFWVGLCSTSCSSQSSVRTSSDIQDLGFSRVVRFESPGELLFLPQGKRISLRGLNPPSNLEIDNRSEWCRISCVAWAPLRRKAIASEQCLATQGVSSCSPEGALLFLRQGGLVELAKLTNLDPASKLQIDNRNEWWLTYSCSVRTPVSFGDCIRIVPRNTSLFRFPPRPIADYDTWKAS